MGCSLSNDFMSHREWLRLQEPHTTTARMAKEKTMAEPQETQQEKETRWAAQRATRDTEQQEMRATRQRKTARNWLIVGAIVIIVAVLAVVVLR
jgi:Flp pilus assembly protein TadB